MLKRITTLVVVLLFGVVAFALAAQDDMTTETLVSDDIVQADIEASNGVVHVINRVLLPPSVQGAEMDEGEMLEEDELEELAGDDDETNPDLLTIAQIINESASHDTLFSALVAAGLIDPLNSADTTFTVFAPTDDAFDDALNELDLTAEQLFQDDELLATLLQYHVVQGQVLMSDEFEAGEEFTMMSGEPLIVDLTGEAMVEEDEEGVAVAEAEETPQFEETEADVFEVETTEVPVFEVTEVEVVEEVIETTELPVFEVEMTEVVDVDVEVTEVMVPEITEVPVIEMTEVVVMEETEIPQIEEEITEIPVLVEETTEVPVLVEEVTEVPFAVEEVTEVPLSEVEETEVPIEIEVTDVAAVEVEVTEVVTELEIVEVTEVPQIEETEVIETEVTEVVEVTEVPVVEVTEIVETEVTEVPEIEVTEVVVGEIEVNTVVDVAGEQEDFTILLLALEEAELVETLEDEEVEYTIFAPTDEAFEAALEELGLTQEDLLENTDLLTQILLYHVVEGTVLAEDVLELDGEEVETLQGDPVAVTVDEDDNVVLNDEVEVIETDITADNGVIHVIDGVLLPEAAVEMMEEME